MRLTEEYMLQEQLTDCYAPESKRHFRIVTCSGGTVFYTREFKHPRKRFEGTVCSSFKCSKTLSAEEKRDLRSIKTQLKTLHISEFQCVPFIGWDVMLTCKGAFVLEGNDNGTVLQKEIHKVHAFVVKFNVDRPVFQSSLHNQNTGLQETPTKV